MVHTGLNWAALARELGLPPFEHDDGGGAGSLRLNFTNSPPARIREGVARLAAALDRLAV